MFGWKKQKNKTTQQTNIINTINFKHKNRNAPKWSRNNVITCFQWQNHKKCIFSRAFHLLIHLLALSFRLIFVQCTHLLLGVWLCLGWLINNVSITRIISLPFDFDAVWQLHYIGALWTWAKKSNDCVIEANKILMQNNTSNNNNIDQRDFGNWRIKWNTIADFFLSISLFFLHSHTQCSDVMCIWLAPKQRITLLTNNNNNHNNCHY